MNLVRTNIGVNSGPTLGIINNIDFWLNCSSNIIILYMSLIWDATAVPFFLIKQTNNVAWPEHGVRKCIRPPLSLLTTSRNLGKAKEKEFFSMQL